MHLSAWKIFLFSFLFTASFVHSQNNLPGVRLPHAVVPERYDLSLQIDPQEDSFSGSVRINLQIREKTKQIWLHGQDLQVQEAIVTLRDGQKISGKYKQTVEDGTSRIDLLQELAPQDVLLELQYTAPFNKKLEGLYKVEEGGKAYVFTQFEAVSARLCFPGFDEPSFKTPFDITLTVPSDDIAISNTLPVEEMELANGRKQIRFARTEKLPTYLIAIAVGPFDVVAGPPIPANDVRNTPVPLRGIAVSGKGEKLKFALQNTGGIFTTLERYFGIAYPFGKLDLIAVPDFDYGAMENAGVITFRETFLLLDEQSASYHGKKSILNVMTHEIAHQWFGDLVTMAWWNDIWLNEGLTSWITNRAMELWNPEYKSNVRAVQSALAIMDRDSSPSARPLSRRADSAQDVKGIADGIIFSKGAAIPLMFENYMGKDEFQKFVRHYLNKHRFSNATSEDFLQALEETAGKEVASSFRSFVNQPGVPLLQVETKCEDGRGSVRVHYSKYVPLGVESSGSASWEIPACFRFQDGSEASNKCVIVTQDSSVPLSDRGCVSWVMPNANGAGYYRWTLSPKGWDALRAGEKGHLSVQEELSIVDSIQAAFDSGRLSANEAFNALEPYASSDVREIAIAPSKLIIFVKEHLASSQNQKESLEKFAQNLYVPAFRKFGFNKTQDDSEDIREFRSEVIDFLAFYARDPEVRKEATKRGIEYIGYRKDGRIHENVVDANLIGTVLGVAVQQEGAEYLDALITLLRGSSDSVLRSRILAAIGRVTAPEQVQRVLALSFHPDLRTDEILSPADALLLEGSNWVPVWKWIQTDYDSLVSRLSPTDAGSLPLYTSNFCTEQHAAEVKNFFEPKISSLPSGSRNLQRAIDQIRLCSARRQAHSVDSLVIYKN